LVFERKPAARHRHRGVHTRRVALERRPDVRRRASPFFFGGLTKSERQKTLINDDGGGAKDLRQPAGCRTPIQLHLPQTVSCLEKAHRPPGVFIRSGKDMRNAEGIESDVNRPLQTGKGDPSV